MVQDKTLAPFCMWNSVRKYYCSGLREEPMVDEINTAEIWWTVGVRHFFEQNKALLLSRPVRTPGKRWLPTLLFASSLLAR